MCFSSSKGIALLILIHSVCYTTSVYADDKDNIKEALVFEVTPQQCVTLREGRDCFTTISIQWEKLTAQSLCLYHVVNKQTKNKVELLCWEKDNSGRANVEFQSNSNLIYQLRSSNGDVLLAEAEVAVSWLHNKTTKRRRWRLF